MTIYAFGSNLACQLGQPDTFDDTPKPTPIPFQEDVIALCCGTMHNIILTKSGVFTWGCNDESALGRNGNEHEITKIDDKLFNNERVIQVSAGVSHSAVLTEKGNVYAWGTFRDRSGIVGFKPNVKFQKLPKKIERNIRCLSSSENCIIMIRKTGSVICYGPELIKKNRRVKSCVGLKSRLLFRGKEKFEKIRCGADHAFLMTEKNVYGFGNNLYGQLGIGHKNQVARLEELKLKNVKEISAGSTHSLFLDRDGNMFGCGSNENGQLGLECKEQLKPEMVMKNVKMISSNTASSMAVKDDGVYTWGDNFYGELGYEDENVKRPKKVEFDFGDVSIVGMGNTHSVVINKK